MRNKSESDAGNVVKTGAHIELCHVVLADMDAVCGFRLLTLSYTASLHFTVNQYNTVKPGPSMVENRLKANIFSGKSYNFHNVKNILKKYAHFWLNVDIFPNIFHLNTRYY